MLFKISLARPLVVALGLLLSGVGAHAELDDLVIARADGTPTYNFCVVVDDWEMGITHVIRGDDHVNNTPRQINILTALGAQVPLYAHLSMILGDDGQKLSKRHGAVSVMQYDEDGYLPEAVLNYLARLGWSHGDEEVFDMDQFVKWFDLDHITASAAQFNTEKLNWLYDVQQVHTALGLVRAGAGYAVLPERSVDLAVWPDLAIRGLHQPEVMRTLCLVTKRGVPLSRAADDIRRALTAAIVNTAATGSQHEGSAL